MLLRRFFFPKTQEKIVLSHNCMTKSLAVSPILSISFSIFVLMRATLFNSLIRYSNATANNIKMMMKPMLEMTKKMPACDVVFISFSIAIIAAQQ